MAIQTPNLAGSSFDVMKCQLCQKREATVHLTTKGRTDSGAESGPDQQHFCEACADSHFAGMPGMNAMRNLICLSDSYRSRLYDLLESEHPEAFDNHDTEACRRGSKVMRKFLHEHLQQDKVDVSGDAFDMLCQDFFGSHHFYTRLDALNRKKR